MVCEVLEIIRDSEKLPSVKMVTDYSTVVKHYDLKAMGLAWTEYNDSHRAVYNDIKELLLKS
jgi:hypothetical protein